MTIIIFVLLLHAALLGKLSASSLKPLITIIIFALESELAKSATKLPDPRVKYAVGEAKMPQRVKDAKTHARTFGSVGYIHAYNVMVRGERLPAPTSMILPGYIFYGPPQQFKVGPRAHSSAQ